MAVVLDFAVLGLQPGRFVGVSLDPAGDVVVIVSDGPHRVTLPPPHPPICDADVVVVSSVTERAIALAGHMGIGRRDTLDAIASLDRLRGEDFDAIAAEVQRLVAPRGLLPWPRKARTWPIEPPPPARPAPVQAPRVARRLLHRRRV